MNLHAPDSVHDTYLLECSLSMEWDLYDDKPSFPSRSRGRGRGMMTPAEHLEWRRGLWGHRGPNMESKSLLPCYVHALEECGVLDTKKKEGRLSPGADTIEGQPSNAAALGLPCTAAPPASLVDAMLAGVSSGQENPFFVIDLGAALDRLSLWREHLPDIHPHYAVKCNGDPALLLTLANAGVGFDCASQAEIQATLELGVPASSLVYANPIKQPSHLRFAAERGVALTVFDGEAELHKLAKSHPSCELLLRLAVDDSHAQCILSNKFGAAPEHAEELLVTAASLGLRVVGVSFHVGSGSSDSDPFGDAVQRAAAGAARSHLFTPTTCAR